MSGPAPRGVGRPGVSRHTGAALSRTCDSPERSELAQGPARPTVARPDTAQPRTAPRDTPAPCVTRRAWGARSGPVVRRAVPGMCRTRARGVPIADGGRRCGRVPASGMVRGTTNRRPGRARGEEWTACASAFYVKRETGQPRKAGRLWRLPDATIRHRRRRETADTHQLPGGPGQLGDGAAASTRVVPRASRAPRAVAVAGVRRSPRHDGGQPFRLGRGPASWRRRFARCVSCAASMSLLRVTGGCVSFITRGHQRPGHAGESDGRAARGPRPLRPELCQPWSGASWHTNRRGRNRRHADGRGCNGTRATRTPCVARMAGHDMRNQGAERRTAARRAGRRRRV